MKQLDDKNNVLVSELKTNQEKEDSKKVKAFMSKFGLTGDPEIDGEDATDDLSAFRQIVEDDKTGAGKEFLERFRRGRLDRNKGD